MIVNQDLFWNDSATRNADKVNLLRSKDTSEIETKDLGYMATFINPYKFEEYGEYGDIRDNPYCREICSRAGNLDRFMDSNISSKERRECLDNACKSFGFRLG